MKEKLKREEEKLRNQMIDLYNKTNGFYRLDLESTIQAHNDWLSLKIKSKEIRKEIFELEEKERIKRLQELEKTKKPFDITYGKTSNREITCETYKRYQRRLSKEIMKFIGG